MESKKGGREGGKKNMSCLNQRTMMSSDGSYLHQRSYPSGFPLHLRPPFLFSSPFSQLSPILLLLPLLCPPPRPLGTLSVRVGRGIARGRSCSGIAASWGEVRVEPMRPRRRRIYQCRVRKMQRRRYLLRTSNVSSGARECGRMLGE